MLSGCFDVNRTNHYPGGPWSGTILDQGPPGYRSDAFVSELEGGLDTPLGERGAGLSEGQMQRVAVARALFSGSPVLLLDEATSALDAATEEHLLRNLRSLDDRMVVVVTHRPAALEICDRAVDLDAK